MPQLTLESIRSARERIGPHIRKTPTLVFDYLNRHRGKQIFLKCELFQRTGSFKIRGATHCVLENVVQARRSGVIAASAGNHAQGVAAICHDLGIPATIVMPTTTPAIKIHNTKDWGATVELIGTVYDECHEYALSRAKARGLVFIHPFEDPHVIAGQGTIGLELMDDGILEQVDAVIVAVGGGGLITGIGTVVKSLAPKKKVYGVTAKNAPATWKSFHTKQPCDERVQFTLAEGVAAQRSDAVMLKHLTAVVDDIFTLDEETIAHAIALLAEHGKLVVEGAGALPVAALLSNLIPENKVAVILSGGNIDLPALGHILNHGLVEQGRLIRLVITLADRPGALHSVTSVLAETNANIQQITHQRTTLRTAIGEVEVEVDLETRGKEHSDTIVKALIEQGYKVKRVS